MKTYLLILAGLLLVATSVQAADENLGIWRNSTTGIWRDASSGEWRPTAEEVEPVVAVLGIWRNSTTGIWENTSTGKWAPRTETVLNVIFRVITSGQKLFERIGVVQ